LSVGQKLLLQKLLKKPFIIIKTIKMNSININIISYKSAIKFLFLSCLMIGLITACDTDELPEEGSLPDETPPSAAFSATPNEADYKLISFTNLSISATDYAWDFGDGNTSTDANPSNTYTADGTYTVKLTATDKLNQSSTTEKIIEVVEPIVNFTPVISEPSFEDDSDTAGCGDENQDGRDCWRNSDLGGVIQITSSPVYDGDQAAKLPSAGDRVGYQLVTVLPETDYKLNFVYTMKTDPVGTLTVSVLGGAVSDPTLVNEATIASVELSDQTSASDYVPASIEFNSGSSSEIAIFFTNVGVECRVDLFEFEE